MNIETVGELKKFLADIPDDTLLVRLSQGYYCVIQPCTWFSYYPNYPGVEGDDYVARRRSEYKGKNLLFI